jgi:hypothetical protein
MVCFCIVLKVQSVLTFFMYCLFYMTYYRRTWSMLWRWKCIFLLSLGVEIKGKRAIVLGRSKIVGGPMASLLMWHHATVTTCHSRTQNMADVVSVQHLCIIIWVDINFYVIRSRRETLWSLLLAELRWSRGTGSNLGLWSLTVASIPFQVRCKKANANDA